MSSPFPLLLDENLPDSLTADLRQQGLDVRTVEEEGLVGRDDTDIIEHARLTGRVVVTQDSGFGALALRQGARCQGVIIVRPGHLPAELVLDTLTRVLAHPPVASPFLVVAHRTTDTIRIRSRHLQ